jgi:hypothetical protein
VGLFTVTIEADGRLAIWAPGASYPLVELEDHEANELAAALLQALSQKRWTS